MAEKSLKNPVVKMEMSPGTKNAVAKRQLPSSEQRESRKTKDGLPKNKNKSPVLPEQKQKQKNSRHSTTENKSNTKTGRNTMVDKSQNSNSKANDKSDDKQSLIPGYSRKAGSSENESTRAEGLPKNKNQATELPENKGSNRTELKTEKKSNTSTAKKTSIDKSLSSSSRIHDLNNEKMTTAGSKKTEDRLLESKDKPSTLSGQQKKNGRKLVAEKKSGTTARKNTLLDKSPDSSCQINDASKTSNRPPKEQNFKSLQIPKGEYLLNDSCLTGKNGDKSSKTNEDRNKDARNKTATNVSSENLDSVANKTKTVEGVGNIKSKEPDEELLEKGSSKNEIETLKKDSMGQTKPTVGQRDLKKVAEGSENRKQPECFRKASNSGKEPIENGSDKVVVGEKRLLNLGDPAYENEVNNEIFNGNAENYIVKKCSEQQDCEKESAENKEDGQNIPKEKDASSTFDTSGKQEGKNCLKDEKTKNGNLRPTTCLIANNEASEKETGPTNKNKYDGQKDEKSEQAGLKLPLIMQDAVTDSRITSSGRSGTFLLGKNQDRKSMSESTQAVNGALSKSTSGAKTGKRNNNTVKETQDLQSCVEPKDIKQFRQGHRGE